MREILFVAGESSGDAHAAGVAREIAARGAPFGLVGVGGDAMRAAGVELLTHVDRLSAMGFVGILEQLPRHLVLLNDLGSRLFSGRVALLVLVDYGGFNLRLAPLAKSAKVPVLYFVTPQVWASRPGRIADLAASVTKAAVIFDFEEALLRAGGVDATFVGHPMLDRMDSVPSRGEARASLGIAADARVLALFPGSRPVEVERHLADFVATARRLQERDPSLEVVVSGAPSVDIDAGRCPFRVVRSASMAILRAADAALCKSGTTTLEATVADCPFVIGYRTGALDYVITRRLITVSDIGMVNIIAGRRVVPEFVQDDLDPAKIAPVLTELLDASSPRRREMMEALASVRARLGTPGASKRVADLALSMAVP